MTKFQEKLKLILAGKFEFSKEEKEKLLEIWTFQEEEPVVMSEDEKKASRYRAQAKYHEKIKNNEDYKRKRAEYYRKYYAAKREKEGYKPRVNTSSEAQRARVKAQNSRPCIYFGEEIKFCTLVMRLHNINGLSFHDANIEAKKYLKEKE